MIKSYLLCMLLFFSSKRREDGVPKYPTNGDVPSYLPFAPPHRSMVPLAAAFDSTAETL